MFQGISRWLIYIALTIIAIMVILSLAGQMGIVQQLKENIRLAKNAGMSGASLAEITQLHRRFTGLLILSFFGFLLLIAGVLTVMQHLRDAYFFSEILEKVRYSMRKIAPGVTMLVIGALALAVATFGYSYLEKKYSRVFTKLHRDSFAKLQPLTATNRGLDTVTFSKPNGTSGASSTNLKTGASSSGSSKNHAAAKKQNLQKTYGKSGVPNATSKKENGRLLAEKVTSEKKKKVDEKIVTPPKETVEAPKNETLNHENIPTFAEVKNAPLHTHEEAINWARNQQRSVVLYGYVPTKNDRKQYDAVMNEFGGEMGYNSDMHWAYNFTLKTRDGYQPTKDELQQFEHIASLAIAMK